jgi:HK97 family phage major capsid protein
VLQDEPQLQSTINNELLYGLRLTEDNQILNGAGTGEDLLGILNTPGIQSYAEASGPASDNKADALRRAATRAVLAYFDPTGIVIHPYDWEDIELAKGVDEHYTIAMNVTVGAEARLWRMNVVDSPAIAEGTGLVGAFGLGAQLYDRMQANIRVAEQHSDLFVRNAVAILAEERLALAVKRPESFVKVTFQ